MHPMIMGTTSEKTKPLRLRDQIIIFSLLNICSNSFVKIKVNRTFSIVKKISSNSLASISTTPYSPKC